MQNANYRFAASVPQYEMLMETAKPAERRRFAKSVSTSYTNPHHSQKKLPKRAARHSPLTKTFIRRNVEKRYAGK
jgi:hypothetical protein